jgi:DNA-binding PadR family transcriptional regulator
LAKTARKPLVEYISSLKELCKDLPGYRYGYLYNALRALEESDLVHPFRGDRNEYLLTLDHVRVLRRFLQLREVE